MMNALNLLTPPAGAAGAAREPAPVAVEPVPGAGFAGLLQQASARPAPEPQRRAAPQPQRGAADQTRAEGDGLDPSAGSTPADARGPAPAVATSVAASTRRPHGPTARNAADAADAANATDAANAADDRAASMGIDGASFVTTALAAAPVAATIAAPLPGLADEGSRSSDATQPLPGADNGEFAIAHLPGPAVPADIAVAAAAPGAGPAPLAPGATTPGTSAGDTSATPQAPPPPAAVPARAAEARSAGPAAGRGAVPGHAAPTSAPARADAPARAQLEPAERVRGLGDDAAVAPFAAAAAPTGAGAVATIGPAAVAGTRADPAMPSAADPSAAAPTDAASTWRDAPAWLPVAQTAVGATATVAAAEVRSAARGDARGAVRSIDAPASGRAAEPVGLPAPRPDTAPGRGDAAFALADPGGMVAVADAAPTASAAASMPTADPRSAVMPMAPAGAHPTGAAPTAVASSPVEARIAAPLHSDAFGPALGLQIGALARDGTQHARLHLNPAEMGPITVRIVVDGTGARIDFHAEAADTRQAIESSLPTLAGALRESGLTLTGGGVFQQPQGQPPTPDGTPGRPQRPTHADGDPVAAADGAAPAPALSARRGLVDLVA